MDMKDKLENFKVRYKNFLKSGSEDLLALKADAERLLAEAKREGDCKVIQELEDPCRLDFCNGRDEMPMRYDGLL
ncbi:MAG: hypothetical protein ACUVTE_04805 [Candidatus Bathycorpusculaceae bacterium]